MAITQSQYDSELKRAGGSKDVLLAEINKKDPTGRLAKEFLAFKPVVVPTVKSEPILHKNGNKHAPPVVPTQQPTTPTISNTNGNVHTTEYNAQIAEAQRLANKNAANDAIVIDAAAKEKAKIIDDYNKGLISETEALKKQAKIDHDSYASDLESQKANAKDTYDMQVGIAQDAGLMSMGSIGDASMKSDRQLADEQAYITTKHQGAVLQSKQVWDSALKTIASDKNLNNKEYESFVNQMNTIISKLKTDEQKAAFLKAVDDKAAGKIGATKAINDIITAQKAEDLKFIGTAKSMQDKLARDKLQWDQSKDKGATGHGYAVAAGLDPYENEFKKTHPDLNKVTFEQFMSGLAELKKNDENTNARVGSVATASATDKGLDAVLKYIESKGTKIDGKGEIKPVGLSVVGAEGGKYNMYKDGKWFRTGTLNDGYNYTTGKTKAQQDAIDKANKNKQTTTPVTPAVTPNSNVPDSELPPSKRKDQSAFGTKATEASIGSTDGMANEDAKWFLDPKNKNKTGDVVYMGGGKLTYLANGMYTYTPKGGQPTTPQKRGDKVKLVTMTDWKAMGSKLTDLRDLMKNKPEYKDVLVTGDKIYYTKYNTKYVGTLDQNKDLKSSLQSKEDTSIATNVYQAGLNPWGN